MTHEEGIQVIPAEQRRQERRKNSNPSNTSKFVKSLLCISQTKRSQCKNTKEGKQRRPSFQTKRSQCKNTKDGKQKRPDSQIYSKEIKPKKQKERYSLVNTEDTDNVTNIGDLTVGDVTDRYDTDGDATVLDEIKPKNQNERYSPVKSENTESDKTVGEVTNRDVPDRDVIVREEIKPEKQKERYSLVRPEANINDKTVRVLSNGDVANRSSDDNLSECSLCLEEYGPNEKFVLRSDPCGHHFCVNCLQQYVKIEIQEGRVDLKCPQCPTPMHPNDIEYLSVDNSIVLMYYYLMVQRVLVVDPDTRWCPAPDCTFGVVAGDCSACPKIDCERGGCEVSFCYFCKEKWEVNHQCGLHEEGSEDIITTQVVVFDEDINLRGCPRCSVMVEKEEDGSCNHMKCTVCGCEFCWLCMKEVTDLHYMSPSGCTFWGKKQWNKKSKTLLQIGTLLGAPLGIGLVAGVSIPAMMIGIPIHVGRKLYGAADKNKSRHRRNLIVAGGVTASTLASPIIAGVTVPLGVIAMLGYTYVAIPISLCRALGGYIKGTRKHSFKRASRGSLKIGNPAKIG